MVNTSLRFVCQIFWHRGDVNLLIDLIRGMNSRYAYGKYRFEIRLSEEVEGRQEVSSLGTKDSLFKVPEGRHDNEVSCPIPTSAIIIIVSLAQKTELR